MKNFRLKSLKIHIPSIVNYKIFRMNFYILKNTEKSNFKIFIKITYFLIMWVSCNFFHIQNSPYENFLYYIESSIASYIFLFNFKFSSIIVFLYLYYNTKYF